MSRRGSTSGKTAKQPARQSRASQGRRKSYDVFLSHSSDDKPAVEVLAAKLEDEAGFKPFLDKWHLVPGEPWQKALGEALDQSMTCAVFIGPEGIGPWENMEMQSALDDLVHDTGFRVIPVLLPGALRPEKNALPRFLRLLTWVDFCVPEGLKDPNAFRRLVAGIKGVAPGRNEEGFVTAPSFEELRKEAVCRFLEDIEQTVNTVELFHSRQKIVLKDYYIPIQVTLERKYRHEVETSWGYTESEEELSHVYALKGMDEDSRPVQVPWEKVKEDSQHIIVLADPGMGKSTLLTLSQKLQERCSSGHRFHSSRLDVPVGPISAESFRHGRRGCNVHHTAK